MGDSMRNRTAPFRVIEQSRIIGSEKPSISDGVYRVLATLDSGGKLYRIFAELIVDDGKAQLRFRGFEAPTRDEWLAGQKLSVPVTQPEIAPLEQKINGADFMLCAPVRLDEREMKAVFGSNEPPAT